MSELSSTIIAELSYKNEEKIKDKLVMIKKQNPMVCLTLLVCSSDGNENYWSYFSSDDLIIFPHISAKNKIITFN